MGELSILRQLVRAKELRPSKLEGESAKAGAKAGTKTGFDANKPYNVKTKDGVVIPFNAGTPVEKAKQWTKNYLSPSDYFDDKELSSAEQVRKLTFKPPADKTYGAGSILYEKETGGGYRIRATELDDKYKGQGYGAALYRQLLEKAKKEGVPVRSDSQVSPEAQAVWRRLKQLGYPIVEKTKKSSDDPLFEYVPEEQMK